MSNEKENESNVNPDEQKETKPVEVINEANGGQTENLANYGAESGQMVSNGKLPEENLLEADEVETPVPVIFIGSLNDNDSAALKSFTQATLPEDMKVEIRHLELDEIANVVKRRESIEAEKSVEEYIKNEDHKKAALDLALSIEKNMNSRGKYFPLNALYKKLNSTPEKINEIVSTLELFGLIEVDQKTEGGRVNLKILTTDNEIWAYKLKLLKTGIKQMKDMMKSMEALNPDITKVEYYVERQKLRSYLEGGENV